MIDSELLEILVCPETKQPVALADEALLRRVNRAVQAGGVHNRGGDPVDQPLEAGLVRADGAVVYPVRDEIPVMLVDEAIAVSELEGSGDGGS